MADYARIVLTGGPFDGEEAFQVPPDVAVPAQIAWGGWFPWGPAAYLYERTAEVTYVDGRTDSLVYRATGRRLTPEEIPPVFSDLAELYASGAALLASFGQVAPAMAAAFAKIKNVFEGK